MDRRIVGLGILSVVGMGFFFFGGGEEPQTPPQEIVEQLPAEPVTVEVLQASRSLRHGDIVDQNALIWAPVAEDRVKEEDIKRVNNQNAIEDYHNAIVITAIGAGEKIRPQMLLKFDRASLMAAMVRKGMRAYSIPISSESAAGGTILAGDYVDVIVLHSVEVEITDRETAQSRYVQVDRSETIMRQVRVMAMDQKISDGEPSANLRTATLEVTPEQVEILALAKNQGRLSLALRSIVERIDEEGNPILDPRPETVFDLRVQKGSEQSDAENNKESRGGSITLLRAGKASTVFLKQGQTEH